MHIPLPGETYLQVLPEALSFVTEACEDADPGVETAARALAEHYGAMAEEDGDDDMLR